MPKISKELGALAVNNLKDDGMHSVGGVVGLYLEIQRGSKSWIFRYCVAGQRFKMGLGSFPSVTLARAREKAREARQLLSDGIDPIQHRKGVRTALKDDHARLVSFRELATQYIDMKSSEWKSAKHAGQWQTTIDQYVLPIIGNFAAYEVSQNHVLRILQPIWINKTETANRVRGRIEQILDYAAVKGLRPKDNPARWRGNLDMLLPRPSKVARVQHHASLHYNDLPTFIPQLMHKEGLAAQALLFLILTASRTSEVLYCQWPEIDLEHQLWTVPENRMKAGRLHRVPLSHQACAILEKMQAMKSSDYVFSSRGGKPFSNMAMLKILRDMQLKNKAGETVVPHGFRSTFRVWCAETGVISEVAEAALAHVIENKTIAAYQRSDLLEQRVDLMQVWSDFIYSLQ